jgi:hypothetical protein
MMQREIRNTKMDRVKSAHNGGGRVVYSAIIHTAESERFTGAAALAVNENNCAGGRGLGVFAELDHHRPASKRERAAV